MSSRAFSRSFSRSGVELWTRSSPIAGRSAPTTPTSGCTGAQPVCATPPRASSARHVFKSTLDPLQPSVLADPDRIAQVVANLLSNAIKYSPDGGEIVVGSVARDGHVDVSVRDHGLGIAPDFLQRLFSRYERYEKTSNKIIGTGLGLAITRQIVEMHSGKICA